MFRWILLALLAAPPAADAGGGIYGTVETREGDVLTGAISWDKNENFWDDLLDGTKNEKVQVRGSSSSVRILGLKISTSGKNYSIHSRFSIPFGHLAALKPGSSRTELKLKSGEVLEVRSSSTDLGSSMRGLKIADRVLGEVELDWEDIERVEFAQDPDGARDDQRLYGTLQTRKARFTGFIVWDRDESLVTDVLDGNSGGKKYKINLSGIAGIEKLNDSKVRVTTTDGRKLKLTGTNDVDSGNRGILVTIPGVGAVDVDWDDFHSISFEPAPPSRRYAAFDGGKRLAGVVTDQDGVEYNGLITWDKDETHTWESLDGEVLDTDFQILFENIASIERLSRKSAKVTLVSGQEFTLRETSDVSHDNKGIVVEGADGGTVELDWGAFARVDFVEVHKPGPGRSTGR